MMKKQTLISLLFLFCSSLYGQSYKIEYSTIEHDKTLQSDLTITDSFSLWQTDIIETSPFGKSRFVLKDESANDVFFSDILFGKSFFVKDSLHNMKWELGSDTRTILGKNCNSAKTTFRGRTYIAFYTNDISIPNGPWKFGGLPGLILEIASTDGLYAFNATSISTKDALQPKIDMSKTNFINWSEYKTAFMDTTNKMIKMMKTKVEIGNTITFKLDGKEIIYPEVQTGEGIIIEQ